MKKKKRLSKKIAIVIILIIQTAVLKNISNATSTGMIILRGVLTFGIIFFAAWLLSGRPLGERKKSVRKSDTDS